MADNLIDAGAEQGGEEQGSSFHDQLPEDLRDDPSLQDIEDVGSLAKSYVHAQRMVGKDKLAMPGEDATQEEIDEFYNKLGRPETPDAYELPETPEDADPRFAPDEEFVGNFKEAAHKMGLTAQQTKDLYEWYQGEAQNRLEAVDKHLDQTYEESKAALQKEYGKAFPEKMKAAKLALQEYGGDAVLEKLEKAGLANDADVVKAFVKAGEPLMEDGVPSGGNSGFTLTPDQAKAEIRELERDNKFTERYYNGNAAGHDEAVKQMDELMRLAYPESQEDEPITL